MYFKFFGLQAKPFQITPDPEFLYLSHGHKQALGSIIYGVKEKKGFIAVTGQVGLGKTTILRSFLAQFDQVNQHTINLFNPNLSFAAVLKILLRELGHDPIKGDDAEVVEQLHMVLIEEYQKGKTVVLLIDEAQNMPVATLEHLRMLSNLETPKDKLIQIVLLGQPELDSLLDRYELRQIRQRIAVRAMIRPLSQQESVQYIRHRLDIAGGKGKKFFTNSALGLIVREAKGIPRRLNILCDNALVTAFGYKQSPVTTSIAKEVISDLAGQPSHSLWKLVPLVAGALILVLALVSLMPLTQSDFSDTPPLNAIGQLLDDGDIQNQDLLNVEYGTNLSGQEGPTLAERAQNFVTESVPEVLEELRGLAVSEPDSNTTQPILEAGIDLQKQGDVVFAKKPLGDLKNSARVVLEESKKPLAPERTIHIIQSHRKEATGLSEQGEGVVTDVAQRSPITKIVKEGDTLAGLMQEVYGSASPSTLRFVLDHNRHIVNVRKMYPGQQIMFPPLERVEIKNRFAEADRAFVSHKGEKLSSSKKIFTGSSAGTKSIQGKTRAKLKQPYAVAVVKGGDTLEKLAKVVYGSSHPVYIQRVLDYNPQILNPKKIFPGQNIAFPRMAEDVKSLANQSSQAQTPD